MKIWKLLKILKVRIHFKPGGLIKHAEFTDDGIKVVIGYLFLEPAEEQTGTLTFVCGEAPKEN